MCIPYGSEHGGRPMTQGGLDLERFLGAMIVPGTSFKGTPTARQTVYYLLSAAGARGVVFGSNPVCGCIHSRRHDRVLYCTNDAG